MKKKGQTYNKNAVKHENDAISFCLRVVFWLKNKGIPSTFANFPSNYSPQYDI